VIRRPTPARLLTIAIAFAFAPGCAKHKDFPLPLGITQPPTVKNFSVTKVNDVTFSLYWEIDDADSSQVQLYRVYFGVQGLGAPELDSEWTMTCPCSPPDMVLPLPLANTVWGVSVVTKENVEGAMVTSVVP
jgi:hypothetical protein